MNGAQGAIEPLLATSSMLKGCNCGWAYIALVKIFQLNISKAPYVPAGIQFDAAPSKVFAKNN